MLKTIIKFGSCLVVISLLMGLLVPLVVAEEAIPAEDHMDLPEDPDIVDEISKSAVIEKTETHKEFNPMKTFSASSIGKKAVFTVHYETPICPVGYPCTLKPLVYANQNVTISGAVKNVGDEGFDCKLTVAVRKSSDNSIVYYAIKENTTHLDPLEVKNFTDIVANDKWLIWNTGTNVGEYYIWGKLEVIGGDTIQNYTPSFQIGKEERVEFNNFRTVNSSYQHNQAVNLSEYATIVNIGNQKVSGTLEMTIWRYDNVTETWDKNFWIGPTASISLDPGEDYPLKDVWPGWDTNAHENGTYKAYMAIVDGSGNVKDQLIGTKPVGKMEITLPTVTVDKYVNPIKVSPGDAQTEVSLRVGSSGHSVRDSGVFMIGNITVSDLDVVFLLDTSGSMINEWQDLCTIIDEIVTSLEEYANITYKIYGLGDPTDWSVDPTAGYTSCADGGWNVGYYNGANLSLTGYEARACECWGPGTAGVARYYNWREDAVRVIFSIADEGPYDGGTSYSTIMSAEDNQSVVDAIAECKANSVIAYPMYGDRSGIEYTKIQMEKLADGTGGKIAYWTDTETAKELITEALFKEIKIAGKNIRITEHIIDKAGVVEPDWNSFKFDDNPILQGDLIITPSGDIKSVTFDKSYLDLSSISASPPEQHIISYTVTLPNLLAGETRKITLDGLLTYEHALFPRVCLVELIPYAFVLTSSECDVIVVVDEARLKEVYDPDSDVDDLMTTLREYCLDYNGTVHNMTVYREKWQKEHPGKDPFGNGREEYSILVRNVIRSLAIDRKAENILLVGLDNILPFYKVESFPNCDGNGDGVPDAEEGYPRHDSNQQLPLWSDIEYTDLNDDWYPDIGIARLIGTPELMNNTLGNSFTQETTDRVMLACFDRTYAENTLDALHTTFRDDWGYTNFVILKEEDGQLDDVKDHLADEFSIIRLHSHGAWTTYLHKEHADWFGRTKYLDASDINSNGLGTAHPFVDVQACHGGYVMGTPENPTGTDPTPSNNNPLAFLDNGAVGFVGSMGYSYGTVGDKVSAEYFFSKCKDKKDVGTALFLARRQLMKENFNSYVYKKSAYEFHLYGSPSYKIYIPNDPPAEQGYTINISYLGMDGTVNVQITKYNKTIVNTTEGMRDLIEVPGATELNDEGMPVVPMIVTEVVLPSYLNLSDIGLIYKGNITAFSNVTLPTFQIVTESSVNSPLSGACSKFSSSSSIYPEEIFDATVINEVDGSKTVVFRIFPLQYSESAHEAYLYKNLTFGYTTKTVPPAPLVDLSVMKSASETIVNVGASTTVSIEIRNTGQLDAKDLIINETLPSGFSASSISNSGVYDSTTNSITWNMDNLAYTCLENFKILSYELNTPNYEGTYDINTTVEYESEAGVTYPPINKTLTLRVFGEEAVDTIPPEVSAEFIPIEVEEHEGLFEIDYSATDLCDPDPEIIAVILTPTTLAHPELELKVEDEIKIEFDLEDDQLVIKEIKGPDPRALWQDIQEIGGLRVDLGQKVFIEIDGETEFKTEEGILKIEGLLPTLKVTATDASGNIGEATAQPVFAPEEKVRLSTGYVTSEGEK